MQKLQIIVNWIAMYMKNSKILIVNMKTYLALKNFANDLNR